MFDRVVATVGWLATALWPTRPLSAVYLFALLLLVAVLQAQEVFGQTSPPPAPRAQVSADEFDAGYLTFGRFKATTSLELRNAGTAVLEIRKVRSSCLCVRASLPVSSLAPGRQARLTLEADGSELLEPLDEAVFLYTNDPAQPLVKIRIHGAIGRPVEPYPVAISIGVTHKPLLLQGTTSVRLTAIDKRPLGRVRVEPSAAFIHAQGAQGADGVYEIEVGFLPTLPLGRLSESIRVHMEHPGQPIVNIPVLGVVTGDVTPVRRVDFGLVPEGTAATAKVQIPNVGSRDVEILDSDLQLAVPGQVSVPGVVEVKKIGRDFELTVRISTPPAFSRLSGVLRLTTDHPEEAVVQLPVAGVVMARHPFDVAATTPDGEARLRGVVAEALLRGDQVEADDFFSRVLGGVRDDRAATLLLRVATDLAENMNVRLRALEFLAVLKSALAREPLRKLVTEDDFEFVRRFALVALVETIGADAMPELLLAMEDDGAWVREDAATLLGRVGDDRALRPLQRATRDPDEDARKAAQAALQALIARIKQ